MNEKLILGRSIETGFVGAQAGCSCQNHWHAIIRSCYPALTFVDGHGCAGYFFDSRYGFNADSA